MVHVLNDSRVMCLFCAWHHCVTCGIICPAKSGPHLQLTFSNPYWRLWHLFSHCTWNYCPWAQFWNGAIQENLIILKDHPTGSKMWSVKPGGLSWQVQLHCILKCRSFCQNCIVCQDGWSLMAVLSQDGFHCTNLMSDWLTRVRNWLASSESR